MTAGNSGPCFTALDAGVWFGGQVSGKYRLRPLIPSTTMPAWTSQQTNESSSEIRLTATYQPRTSRDGNAEEAGGQGAHHKLHDRPKTCIYLAHILSKRRMDCIYQQLQPTKPLPQESSFSTKHREVGKYNVDRQHDRQQDAPTDLGMSPWSHVDRIHVFLDKLLLQRP
jgi:hypothetical protein